MFKTALRVGLLLGVALVVPSIADAQSNSQLANLLMSQSNSLRNSVGGYDYSSATGRSIGSSRPNIFGGYNYSGATGRSIGSSRPNIFGGYNYRGW